VFWTAWPQALGITRLYILLRSNMSFSLVYCEYVYVLVCMRRIKLCNCNVIAHWVGPLLVKRFPKPGLLSLLDKFRTHLLWLCGVQFESRGHHCLRNYTHKSERASSPFTNKFRGFADMSNREFSDPLFYVVSFVARLYQISVYHWCNLGPVCCALCWPNCGN
jgi:hypothetical protein